ncbi:hypothetical protein RchiOBHm_Chr4g0443781 [Rosa chinensis]|uniref:Uncharacterized protein n=1 Tax=Rosa chinensis TaxID=74649 RepID=A0A2P6R415_ROSCH|nr:uncharacterized protein LOC112197424 [Rosa chinensis]PRQ41148.1 hypothetical protein RchiOBHm_Chr4g0443781 [Rosa chinensis]
MQAISVPASSPSLDSYVNSKNNFEYSQLSANFTATVKVSEDVKRTASGEEEKPEKETQNDVAAVDEDEIEVEEEEEEEEFSFFCTNPDGSPISADDAFQDGQIRPVYPIFNRDLLFADAYDGGSSSRQKEASSSSSLRPPLKKLFFEDRDAPSSSASESDELEAVPEGSYCEWSKNAKEVSPELRNNKSNSTGSSKLWRIRDLVPRSNSDGKDAFVFLNPNSATPKQNRAAAAAAAAAKSVKPVEKAQGQKGKKAETVSSAHEKHYVMNRAKKEGDKRRSYLPYRPGVVGFGFFTNVNGLSRNVHPF